MMRAGLKDPKILRVLLVLSPLLVYLVLRPGAAPTASAPASVESAHEETIVTQSTIATPTEKREAQQQAGEFQLGGDDAAAFQGLYQRAPDGFDFGEFGHCKKIGMMKDESGKTGFVIFPLSSF